MYVVITKDFKVELFRSVEVLQSNHPSVSVNGLGDINYEKDKYILIDNVQVTTRKYVKQ